jgi:hypothetical protein
MKQIIKRCSNIGADVLGFIKVGGDSLAIIEKNNEIKGVLNGCEIFKTSNFRDDMNNIVCVFGDLAKNLYNKNKPEDFTIYKEHWASDKHSMGGVLDLVLSNLKKEAKVTLKVRAKESSINFDPSLKYGSKIDPSILNKNVNVFSLKLNNAGLVLQNFLRCASVLTRCKLENKDPVWGEKEISSYISDIRGKIASNDSEIGKLDFYKEMIEKTASKIHLKLSSELFKKNSEERKILGGVLIPELIDNYEGFKKLATSVVFAAAPLACVDDMFRKYTNYPASWFISDDVLIGLNDGYAFLINFMQELPRIETNAIIPLDVYGTQILNKGR